MNMIDAPRWTRGHGLAAAVMLVVALLPVAVLAQADPEFEQRLDESEVSVGSATRLIFDLTWTGGPSEYQFETLTFPRLAGATISGLEVATRELDDSRSQRRYTISIRIDSASVTTVPERVIRWTRMSDGAVGNVVTAPASIRGIPRGPDEAPPAPQLITRPVWIIAFVVLVISAIAVATLVIRTRRGTTAAPDPYDDALAALNAARESRGDDPRAFQHEAYAVLVQLLGRISHRDLTPKSGPELVDMVTRSGMSPAIKERIVATLNELDTARFAPGRPEPGSTQRLMHTITETIRLLRE